MEDLIEVIFVFIAIGASIISFAAKAKKRKEAAMARQAASPVKRTAPKASHPYAAQPTVMPPMSFSDVPGQVIAPTVHTHIQPDCETHDAPGSLGVVSSEGKDPCHEEQLQTRPSIAEPIQEENGLTFDWSGENLVKAFVMQEVLTRPANRLPQRQAR